MEPAGFALFNAPDWMGSTFGIFEVTFIPRTSVPTLAVVRYVSDSRSCTIVPLTDACPDVAVRDADNSKDELKSKSASRQKRSVLAVYWTTVT